MKYLKGISSGNFEGQLEIMENKKNSKKDFEVLFLKLVEL